MAAASNVRHGLLAREKHVKRTVALQQSNVAAASNAVVTRHCEIPENQVAMRIWKGRAEAFADRKWGWKSYIAVQKMALGRPKRPSPIGERR